MYGRRRLPVRGGWGITIGCINGALANSSYRVRVLFDHFVGDRQLVLAASGVYTLTVRGNGVDDSGTYSFRLLEAPPNEPPAIAAVAGRVAMAGREPLPTA